jgi:hypothetical protein
MTFRGRGLYASTLVFTLAALALGTAAGCEGIKAPSFNATLPSTPTTVTMHSELDGGASQVAAKAIMCDDAKLDVVKKNGGVFLGDLELHGEPSRSAINTSTTSDTEGIHARAMSQAAEQGATHIWVKSSDLKTDAPRIGSSGINSSMYTVHYSLYRVPAESWTALPPELMPQPFAGKASAAVASPDAGDGG